jgi:CheY-like chemotaxis protein
VLKKQLVKLGYKVSIANHGLEALNFLQTTRFSEAHRDAGDGIDLSVVLMDSEMPIMDGITAVRRIREMQREGTLVEHVPVIAITANARIEQVNAALSAGMDDVVAKPFRVPELVAHIDRLERAIRERNREEVI